MTRFKSYIYCLLVIFSFVLMCCKPPTTNEKTNDTNSSPSIVSISISSSNIFPQDSVQLSVVTEDLDGDQLDISWFSSYGIFLASIDSTTTVWVPGNSRGEAYIGVSITDGKDTVIDSVNINVKQRPLTVKLISPERVLKNYSNVVNYNEIAKLTYDTPELDNNLEILWSCASGSIIGDPTQDTILWDPGSSSKYVIINLKAEDDAEIVNEDIGVYVNTMPNAPELLYPINNKIIGTSGIAFIWDSSDPDYEELTHNLTYTSDGVNFKTITEIESNFYKPNDLKNGDQISWTVESVDNNGLVSDKTENAFSIEVLQSIDFDLGGSGEFVNMVLIPKGKYFRGAPNEIGAGSDEEPVVEVTINNDLWVSKFEITQKQWISIMGPWNFGGFVGDSLPTGNFTINEAKTFIGILNDYEGEVLWRLPTESEWEYICRANHYDSRYFWGDDPNNAFLGYFGWYDQNSGNRPHAIGSTLMGIPNPWGLWDMQGNAYEMCEDYYYYDYNTAPTDGSAQLVSFNDSRVIRGGTWAADNRRLRAAHRSWLPQGNKADAVGIRLIREKQ